MRLKKFSVSLERAAPPEMNAQNFQPKRRWILRDIHTRLRNFLPFCVFKVAVQPLRFALAFELPLNSRVEQVEHARHSDQCGGAFLLDGAHDLGRIARWFEYHGRSQQRRNEQSHELPKNVAQRNERDETQRV